MKKGTHIKLDNSFIPNTNMEIILIDDIETAYTITPKEGYKLHAKELDSYGFDEESMTETDEFVPGFTTGTKTCHINYDFEVNLREFYAVKDGDYIEGL